MTEPFNLIVKRVLGVPGLDKGKAFTYVLHTQCSACFSPLTLPEPYVTWVLRTFGVTMSEIRAKCITCGGKYLDDYTFISPWWMDPPTQNGTLYEYKPVRTPAKETRVVVTQYMSFSEALRVLRTFVINPVPTKEVVNERHSEVEYGVMDEDMYD